MSNNLEAKWAEFRNVTVQGSPDEPAARFFFYAGMQAMYNMISEAPKSEIEHAMFMNDLQRQLLEDIRARQESTNGNEATAE